jgi:hypothetical protein
LRIAQPIRKLFDFDGNEIDSYEKVENGSDLIGMVAGDVNIKIPNVARTPVKRSSSTTNVNNASPSPAAQPAIQQ